MTDVVVKILKEVEVLTALIGVIIIESYALSQGINGAGLSIAITVIAGLGGYELDKVIKILKRVKSKWL